MFLRPEVLYAILAMTCFTLLNRWFGYWVMQFVPLSGRLKAALEALPGAILIAVVAPSALKAGITGLVCITATALFMWKFKNSSLAVLFGVAIVILLRQSPLVL